jgi:glycosyltransferase involved in cell wall biosynthesis
VRLLLAITELALGGAEHVVLDLERGAAAAGHAVLVAAAGGPLEERAASFVLLPAAGRTPLALARSGRRLTGVARSFRPDVVHAHNPRMTALAAAARAARRGSRPTLLATHHGVPPERAQAAARLLRLADHVVCVSAQLADELERHKIPRARITVIPNGVSASPALDAAQRARLDAELGLGVGPVVTAVGRLMPQKAHHRLIDAAATVHAEHPDTRFLIVGDGPLRAELEEQVRATGLEGVVMLTGPRQDARLLVARSDVIAFSSEWEGLSLVALEALAAGTPIVSTDVAGTAEVLESGAGVAVPHTAPALAGAIAGLLSDPARRRAMADAGRRLHSDRFSTERMVERYVALYERAVTGTL